LNQEDFLTRNIARFSAAIESSLSNVELAQSNGLLQGLDSRVKLLTTVLLIVAVGLTRSFIYLSALFILVIVVSTLSRIGILFFLKRILFFIPLFTLIIVMPAFFLTPGEPVFILNGHIIFTLQGIKTALFLFLRVTDSLSLGILLVLTTPWNQILVSLRWFKIPTIFIDVLGMTYRYLFLLLHTTNSLFLARRSRTIGSVSSSENRHWLARASGMILTRTQHLSEEVYLSMLSRGYQGEFYVLRKYKLQIRDWLWTALILCAFVIALWNGFK
jgi:cobalt/nickel transport system permease protein